MKLLTKILGRKKQDERVVQREEDSNVYGVHEEDKNMNWAMEKAQLTLHYFEISLKNPKSYQNYFSIKVRIEDNGTVEHVWLTEPSFDDDGNLFGVVGNEPLDVRNIKFNQKIGIDKTHVSDWMIIEYGRLIGGYTIRAVREKINENHYIITEVCTYPDGNKSKQRINVYKSTDGWKVLNVEK